MSLWPAIVCLQMKTMMVAVGGVASRSNCPFHVGKLQPELIVNGRLMQKNINWTHLVTIQHLAYWTCWTWSTSCSYDVQMSSTHLCPHCFLSVPPCRSGRRCSSCWLQQVRMNQSALGVNTQQNEHPLSYAVSRVQEEWHDNPMITTETFGVVVSYRQTGLHKPPTAPWTSSQPPLCSLGFCQGATSGQASCTCHDKRMSNLSTHHAVQYSQC